MVHTPALELGTDGSNTPLGFIKCLYCFMLPELPITAIFKTGKGQDHIELLSMRFELRAPPNEASGDQKRLYEVEYAIRTVILPLGFKKHPIQTAPLRGLTRCIY
ncbi:hypothetical protein NTG1052_180034 [Candidatus Nitrotoga sp. 1052]|nr:hypothetical protein NTG1052_180034 [Candidatus Nitrotoga sp. 1052]